MTRRPGRARRGAALLATVAVTVLVPLAATATAAAPAAPGPSAVGELEPAGAALPVEVRITAVTPQVLDAGEDLTVRVELRNTGDVPVTAPRTALHLDSGSFISRSSLDRWRTAAPDARTGPARVEDASDVPLPPGATRTVQLTLPADRTGLGPAWEDWGAHGIAVTVVDEADPARTRLGSARSFMLWFPRDEVTPTRVSVLVPVVGGTPDTDGTTDVEELADLTAPDGRLAAVLEATATHKDVTWLLDPSLAEVPATAAGGVGDAADDGEGSTGEDGEVGTSEDATVVDAWVADLLRGTIGRDVPLLPYGDADLTALAHAGEPDVLTLARERARDVAEGTELPDTASAALALPAESLPDLVTAGFAQAGSPHAVVVGPGELLPPGALTYTPSGRTSVSTAAGDVTVLVPDERLSTAVRAGGFQVGEDRPDGDVAPTGTTPATAAQDVLAELAVVTRERPSDSRHLLIGLPRDWHPDPAIASAQLGALEAAPWVRLEPLSALVGAPDPGIDRGTLPERVTAEGAIEATTLDTVEETLATRVELAEIAEDPASLLGDPDGELLAAVATAWRADPAGRRSLVERSVATTQDLRSAVQVRSGSQINLISTTGELPVVVENTLDQAVEVGVTLRPQDPRLRVDDAPLVTLAPRATETVHVPVHAIQSADVGVAVELRTSEGVLLDDSTVMEVRVRAEWEGIGTAVLGALLAIGVVIGLVRTVRRGRTGRRSEPVAAGPDALSPEEESG
ncbi:hypothetical protein GXB85_17190 [Cellulomonas sp. APG4]|uniref:DUF6049 family protein n=1 Tax=Cellulomonas sp. APG4 TaxID=1538656 RepID=UPI00137A39BA|nr:DUF6049 family protein [Cellulomonas sp. APG4]NCT92672.1 hypothetical protein [Cellulomonas sp. APG4]